MDARVKPAHDEPSWPRRRQCLLDLRLEHGLEVLGRDGADELERDAAIAADQERLRNAIDAPLDGSAAVLVGAHQRRRAGGDAVSGLVSTSTLMRSRSCVHV